jgi:hypothetical protein
MPEPPIAWSREDSPGDDDARSPGDDGAIC